jgi:uncharacterized caspase-like protein
LWLASPALSEKRVAFVVGIDKYDHLSKGAQLSKARNDAGAVGRLLKDLGFEVIAKEDVTRSVFNSHWQDFLNKLMPGDIAAFYFAGHGVEFGGRSYLLPRDIPNLKPGRDELLRREALSLQEFLADLREKGTRLNLVILDACRDNPFEQGVGRSVGSRRGLAITEPPEGTFIMYSAGAGETALDRLDDRDRDPNSVYTRHLLPLLKSPDLSLTEVAEQVRVVVREMAARAQHRQTPAYYNQVVGHVCIAGGDCARRVAGSGAADAWDRTKDTTSMAVLDAFIRRFGDTYYGDLAKVRLAELKEAEAAAQRRLEDNAKAEAERQRAALLDQEDAKKRAEAAKQAADAAAMKKADEEARARMEAERQRLALLQQEEQRRLAEKEASSAKQDLERKADAERKRLALLKAEEDRQRVEVEIGKADNRAQQPKQSGASELAALHKEPPGAKGGPWNGTWSGISQGGPFVITIVDNKVVQARWPSSEFSPATKTIRVTDKTISFTFGGRPMAMRLAGPDRATVAFGRAVAVGGGQSWTWEMVRSPR